MRELSNFLDCHLGSDPETLRTAVDQIVDTGYLLDHLRQLLDHPSTSLPRISAYVHPNGFAKIRLARNSPFWTLRLHVWEHPEQEVEIHSHRWHFASRLLTGSLITKNYRPVIGSGPYIAFHCRRDEHRYVFTRAYPIDLSPGTEHVYRAGDSYLQLHHLLHTVDTRPPPPTITVALQGRDIVASSIVVPPSSHPSQIPTTNLSTGDIAAILRMTVESLTQ